MNSALFCLALVLAGATVYPSPDAAPIRDGVVVVEGDRIVAVGARAHVRLPRDAEVIDASGRFIVAGFTNSHVHFTEPKWNEARTLPAERLSAQLEAFALRWGFTTVVDIGSSTVNTIALRERIEGGEVRGPRIFTTGIPLYPENGIPWYLREALPPEVLAQLHTPATPQAAEAIIAHQLAQGADGVKLFTGAGMGRGVVKPMDPATARAAVDAARRLGRPVFAHASDISGLEPALHARVGIIAHALDDTDTNAWSAEVIRRMVEGNMALIPTLKLFGKLDHIGAIQRKVGEFARAGGVVLFGTDVGFLEDYDPQEEYVLMGGAGLGWRAILASLTTAPARRFGGIRHGGQVAPGMPADLVVLDQDPAADARAFAAVVRTIRGGRTVYERRR